jgi:uncharacterized membrane protein
VADRAPLALDGLARPLAEIGDQALFAKRPPRQADIAPVQNKPVVCMTLVFGRHRLLELAFDFERRLADGQPGTVSDPEDVRVDRNRRLAKGDIENHIGRFAADAGQCFKRFTGARNRSAVLLDELPGQGDDVLCLGAEQADRLDHALQALFTERQHLFRGVGDCKQGWRRLIHAGISRLRGQHHGNKKGKRIDVLKLAFGHRGAGLEAPERFLYFRRCPLRQRAGGGLSIRGDALPDWLERGRFPRASRPRALGGAARGLSRGLGSRFATFCAICFASHGLRIVNHMSCDNDAKGDLTIFSAVLTPQRSLSQRGFLCFMLILGGVSFTTGMFFLIVGAWPVFGFCGLDVLLIYWAFRVSYRRARAYEEVTVTPSELTVRQISHYGSMRQWTLNPLWVRLDRVVHAEFGIERLFVVSHGRRLAIAGFLGPQEKESFAHALAAALGEAKRGPTRTVFQ